MLRPTRVIIDTQALRHNLNRLKTWNGDHFFCPMVKANAYGHGDALVARVLEEVGVSALGVALVEEGIQLREQGVRVPIIAYGPISCAAARVLSEYQITPVAGGFEDLEALTTGGSEKWPALHLKFNTGMQRIGFDPAELPKLREYLQKHATRLQVHGVCTHLTHGEDILDTQGPSQAQIAQFLIMSRDFPGHKHVHKSATLAKLGEATSPPHFPFGARPGIAVYGLPFNGRETSAQLKPVLRWETQLVRVHEIEKGQTVSYSARWTAPRRSVIGVLPMGYGDGYLRALSNKGEMLFRGKRVPVVGSVCMDYTMLDLTDAIREGLPQVGEKVVVLGEQGQERILAEDIADKAGTIAYEVVTAISARVAREAV